MTKIYSGKLNAETKKIGIVVSKFNAFITERLLTSTVETLKKAGVQGRNISVVWVPGALEIPFFCKRLAEKRKYDALIALGCVIRGGTYHFECVAQEVTRGISQVSLETKTPIATAVLTVDNLEQAIDRAGLKAGNKGADAALTALEIADLNQQFKGKSQK